MLVLVDQKELVDHLPPPAQLRQLAWPQLPLSEAVHVSALGAVLPVAHHRSSRQQSPAVAPAHLTE